MDELTHRLLLDMFDTLSQTTIKAKKGDSACKIYITLTKNGKIFNIGEGCYATFNAKKSDGNFIYDNCTIEGGTIVYDFSSSVDENGACQVSAIEGNVDCEVTLYNVNGAQLTSPRFTLYIDDVIYNGEEIASSPEADVLKGLIAEAKTTIDEMKDLIEQGDGGGGTDDIVPTDNLFDKSIAISGQGWFHGNTGPALVVSPDMYYAHVPLRGAGIYRTKISIDHHTETYAIRVPILKEDNTFIQNAVGTLIITNDTNACDLEFTVTEEMVSNGASIYAFDCHKNHLDTVMIVKDRDYPTEYIPYGYVEVETDNAEDKLDNVLQGKTAIFLGDSICAGTTTLVDAPEYGYGWAGLIGVKNEMSWGNFGKNGGVIISIDGVEEAKWLTTQVDTALETYPTADYVIFEGGCNDAAIVGEINIGTLSTSGYSPTVANGFFTNEFEILVSKIINAYPNAKIGYIVAPKMGASGDYSSENNIYRKFFDRAVAICEKWGIPVLDLWKCTPLNPMLQVHYDSSLTPDEANLQGKIYTDGQHLTLEGYQRITPIIESWMRTLDTYGVDLTGFASREYVDNAVVNKITSPETAEIGQTIIVKSVDDNGKPTEWEMANMPEGSGSCDCVSYAVKYSASATEAVSVLELPFNDTDMIDKLINADRIYLYVYIAKPTTDDTDATVRGTATFKITNDNVSILSSYVDTAKLVPYPTDFASYATIEVNGIMAGARLQTINPDNASRSMMCYVRGTTNVENPVVNTMSFNNIKAFKGNTRFQLSTSIPMGAGSYFVFQAYRGEY